MKKEHKVIQYLLEQDHIVTASELSQALHISKRTILNYIRILNMDNDGIILSSSKGYKLNRNILPKDFLKIDNNQHNMNSYHERKNYILEKLLLAHEKVTIDSLLEHLFITEETLRNEFSKLRNELKEYNLFIKTKKNEVFIIGEEKHIRKYILLLLNNELEDALFETNRLQKFFTYVNITEISSIVEVTLNKYEYFLDDFSLLNYVLHLAICIETTHHDDQSKNVELPPIETNHPSIHIIELVKDIYEQLKQIYNVQFSFEQIYDTSILMSTRLVSKNLNKINYTNLEQLVGFDIKNLLSEIVNSVHDTYGIDLKIDNFLVRFALHLKNVVYRANYNLTIPANNFITIKDEFPFLYVISTYIADIINKKMCIRLDVNEISYITLHMGVLMEEKKAYDQKVTYVLVLYNYYDLDKQIISQLNQISKDLLLLDIVSSYEQIHEDANIDLIITTLPIHPSFTIPQIKISMIPTKKEHSMVLSKIEKIKEIKKNHEIIKHMRKFMHDDLFFIRSDFSTKREILHFLCSSLIDKQYVHPTFEQAIYEREEVASSEYQNIAIPHPLSADIDFIYNSSISILICPNAVQWSYNRVNIIFMIALKKEDRAIFRDVFSLLTDVLTNETSFNKLIQVSNFEEFLNIFINE